MFPKPRGAGSDKPEVFLGAFGKHPGWNDHIDDQGLETQQLIEFKRLLYLSGVSAAIDSGAWDRLDESQRVEGFGHVVAMSRRGEIIACRLWSSSDGKGRTKYPMAVCVHAKNVPLSWVLSQVLPKLERLQARCVETQAAAPAIAILDNARVELRAALPQTGSVMDPVVPRVLAQLAQRPELQGGPGGEGGERGGHEGVYRLLYQIQRDCKDFISRQEGESKATRNLGGGLPRPQHIRVPACADSPAESIQTWIQFLHHTVDRSVTVTVVVPSGSPPVWADLIVGEPEGAQFFCLRAAPRALPPVTQVPYSIDQAFVDECEARIKRSQEGKEDATIAQAAAATGGRPKGLLSKIFGGRKPHMFIVLALVLVAAGAIILIVLLQGSSGGEKAVQGPKVAREGAADTPKQTTTPPKVASDTPAPSGSPVFPGPSQPGATADEPWQQLCDHFNNWGLLFIQQLKAQPAAGGGSFAKRQDMYQSDAYLARVLKPLFQALQDGVAIDPRSIAEVPKGEPLAPLRNSPPPGARKPEARERITRSLNLMGDVARDLSPATWPALKQAVSLEKRLRDGGGWGIERVENANFLQEILVAATITSSHDLASGIDRLLDPAVARTVQSLSEKLQTIDTALAAAKASGDPELARLPAWAMTQLGGGAPADTDQKQGGLAGLQALDTAAGKVAQPLAPLIEFLARNATNIDRDALNAKRAKQASSAGGLSREAIVSWLDDARKSVKLSAELDPRRTWTMDALLADAAAFRTKLQSELGKEPDPALVAEEKKLADEVASLKLLTWNSDTQDQLTRVRPRLETDLHSLVQKYDNAYSTEKVRMTGSAKEVREEFKRRETIVRSDVINAAWRAERDRILDAFLDPQYTEMGAKVERASARLVALDEAVSVGIKIEPGVRRWAAALISEAQNERERRLDAALKTWSAAGPDDTGDRFNAMQDSLVKDYSKWTDEIDRLATDLASIETLMSQGFGYDEKPVDPPRSASIRGLLSPWLDSQPLKDPGVLYAIEGLISRAKALQEQEKVQDRQALRGAIASATFSNPEKAIAAWRQLGNLKTPAWPADLNELNEELTLQKSLSSVTAEVRPLPRKEKLEQEFAAERAVRWQRAFASFKNAGDIEAASNLIGAFGVDPDSLPHRLRYNLKLIELKQRVVAGAPSIPDDKVIRTAGDFAGVVAKFDKTVSDAPDARLLLAELTAIASTGPVSAPTIDVTKLGPGSLPNWKGESKGTLLEFSHSSGATPLILRFVRVDPDGAPAFYIGQTEVSLGTVMELLNSAGTAAGAGGGVGAWADFRQFWSDESADRDPRFGPRVWQWTVKDRSIDKIKPTSDRWQKEVFRMKGAPPDSPADLGIKLPTPAHPMNYLSPAAAVYIASLAGTRLPTSQEWQSADHKFPTDLAVANLRDTTWKIQHDYIKDLIAKRPSTVVFWPDAGMFCPSEPTAIPRGESATNRPSHDGVVWFAPAAPDDVSSLAVPTHLVGNVAEYVIDAVPPSPPDGGSGGLLTAAMVISYMTTHKSATRIIGGSALSPPQCPVDKPLALTDPEESTPGYADVGFRLAFSATGSMPAPEPLFRRFARAVGSAVYLEP